MGVYEWAIIGLLFEKGPLPIDKITQQIAGADNENIGSAIVRLLDLRHIRVDDLYGGRIVYDLYGKKK